jgi:hypothetical protein
MFRINAHTYLFKGEEKQARLPFLQNTKVAAAEPVEQPLKGPALHLKGVQSS